MNTFKFTTETPPAMDTVPKFLPTTSMTKYAFSFGPGPEHMPNGATFVFSDNEPDVDSVGAAAVTVLKKLGLLPYAPRIDLIDKAFYGTTEWSPQALPTLNNLWPNEASKELATLAAICSLEQPLEVRVALMAVWLLFGGRPVNDHWTPGVVTDIALACGIEDPMPHLALDRLYGEAAFSALMTQKKLVYALARGQLIPRMENGIALIDYPKAIDLGFSLSPVVVSTWPTFKHGFQCTIACWAPMYLDVKALLADLQAADFPRPEDPWRLLSRVAITGPKKHGSGLTQKSVIALVNARRKGGE